MDDDDLRDQILRLEAQIDELTEVIERLSKGYSRFKGLLTVAHRLHANELIDFVVIPFYGPAPPSRFCWVFCF